MAGVNKTKIQKANRITNLLATIIYKFSQVLWGVVVAK